MQNQARTRKKNVTLETQNGGTAVWSRDSSVLDHEAPSLALGWFLGFLGQKNSLDVWQHSALGDGNAA